LLAVELLDDTASPSTQIWHRAKLADALGQVNSMDEARLHYRQSEDLATTHQLAWLRMAVLNNWAYMELTCGFAEAARQVADWPSPATRAAAPRRRTPTPNTCSP
jgi:hypothetical protein